MEIGKVGMANLYSALSHSLLASTQYGLQVFVFSGRRVDAFDIHAALSLFLFLSRRNCDLG